MILAGAITPDARATVRPSRCASEVCRPFTARLIHANWLGRSRNLQPSSANAGGDSSEAAPAGMTKEEALDILGLEPTAQFEQVMSAKNKKTRLQRDPEKLVQIDTAYDVLLMENMKQRMSGKADVAKSVRFADVPRKRPQQQKQTQSLPGGLRVEAPPQQTLTTQSAVFGLFAIWTLVQALTAPPGIPGVDNATPGLQIALACGASVYFLRENKRLGLGKAVGLTGGASVFGTLLGALVQNWLRVDIVPLGSFSSPGSLVGEFAILALWFSSTFVS